MARTTPTLPLARIRIGTRHRQDLGDLPALAADIRTNGLLHPLPVTPDGQLVAGLRRLEAWRLAHGNRRPVPVHVVDIAAIAAGELAENTQRKDLTPSEMVALMRDVMPAIQAAARDRQRLLGRTHGTGPLPGNLPGRGEARTLAARLVGCSPRTLAKAAAVVDAASADPERFGRLVEAMDRTGRVDSPFQRLQVMRAADRLRAEPPPLPSRGPYRVLSIDFPWPFDPDATDQSERGTHPYPLMTYAEIRAFWSRILAIAHADLAAWVWVTNHHLPAAYAILAELAPLGLKPKTLLTWVKDRIGRGRYLREVTEHAILVVRGQPVFALGAEATAIEAPRRGHSEKPAAFYELVERVCPAPRYACLFSHAQRRPGWDSHSTEAETPPEPARSPALEETS